MSVIHSLKFVYLTLLCILIIPCTVLSQQGKSTPLIHHPFATVVSSDGENNHILLDLTGMPDFFERAYLLDLLFTDPKLVVNNSSLSKASLDLFSSRLNDIDLVLRSLEENFDRALSAGKTMSENQKKELLKKYEKYR